MTSRSGLVQKGEHDLLQMHHEQEDLAAKNQAQPKSGDGGDKEGIHAEEADGKATGQPGEAKKRKRTPEGGGVAGKDAKRNKNAYEISELLFTLVLSLAVLIRLG